MPPDMRFVNQYEDVLHNIEHVILKSYRAHPDLVDFHVDKALEALARRYQAEQKGHEPQPPRLKDLNLQIYDEVGVICEIALGRAINADRKALVVPEMQTITVDEMIACIKHLRSSVSLWTKEYGRQGYLGYIAQFDI